MDDGLAIPDEEVEMEAAAEPEVKPDEEAEFPLTPTPEPGAALSAPSRESGAPAAALALVGG